MKRYFLCFIAVFLSGILISADLKISAPDDAYISAQMGIQIKTGAGTSAAKIKNILNTGDLIRIYLKVEEEYRVWIIHSDDHSVDLIAMFNEKRPAQEIILPSLTEYYKIKGDSNTENITIIISPHNISGLDPLLKNEMSLADWNQLKQTLIKKGSIIVSSTAEKLFSIAGNVRGNLKNNQNNSFFEKVRTYTGKGCLIKSYEFKIKK